MELVDRCLRMDDLPPEQGMFSSTDSWSASIPLNRPASSPARTDGGYTGILNNGSVEDLAGPVLSEWAHSGFVLWEKLTSRRLIVYERTARTLFVRHLLIHAVLCVDDAWRLFDPETQTNRLSEVKFLMAGVVRDLATHTPHESRIEIRLDLRMVGPGDETRSVTLNTIAPETIRNPSHFLLDCPEIYPWFFSDDLRHGMVCTDPTSFSSDLWHDAVAPGPLEDPVYDPSTTLSDLARRTKDFDCVHVLVFCSDCHYPILKTI